MTCVAQHWREPALSLEPCQGLTGVSGLAQPCCTEIRTSTRTGLSTAVGSTAVGSTAVGSTAVGSTAVGSTTSASR